MCLRLLRIALAAIAGVAILPGCVTTLKTAKTIEGGSLTLGAQRYVTENDVAIDGQIRTEREGHYFLVALGRAGRAARRDRIGFEMGLRVVTDVIDHPESRNAGWLLALEPRIQPWRNPYIDVSLGVELLSIVYPGGISLYLSRDVTPWLTPYAEIKGQLLLWQLTQGERVHDFFPRVTIGTALASRHFGTLYLETEGYTTNQTEDPWRVNVGIEFPAIAGNDAPPDSLRAPRPKGSRGIR